MNWIVQLDQVTAYEVNFLIQKEHFGLQKLPSSYKHSQYFG